MNLQLSEDDEFVYLQLDQNESDKIMGDCEGDRAAVFHDIYLVADDFFIEDDADLPIHLDIGVPCGTLRKEATGRYDWKR